jgi:hypothetical protein
MRAKLINERFDWTGRWIPEESPFERAGEYSLKQDLIEELSNIVKKYEKRIKDSTIVDALEYVSRKYHR